jgi:hypothetical protein
VTQVQFMTRAEAAAMLRVTPAALAKWHERAVQARNPDLAPPSVKIGKLRRYRVDSLIEWVVKRDRAARRKGGSR